MVVSKVRSEEVTEYRPLTSMKNFHALSESAEVSILRPEYEYPA